MRPLRSRLLVAPVPSDVELRAVHPSQCPFCRSSDVTAADRKLTASTYWRCETCGQVWHPERLRSALVTREDKS
jgi:ribosomal protein L37AE/L43A